jgi:catechol 2,3-dioxygenase-like lactoylglutathione lyase family enzyme
LDFHHFTLPALTGAQEMAMAFLKPHVSLNVSRIDASVAFYEKLFGMAPTKRKPGYAKFDVPSPPLNLTMQEGPRTGVNASHFGLQVTSTNDVLAAKARYEAAGLATVTEESTTCCFAVQDKVWVHDPDGNAWEIFVVKADAETMGDPTPALAPNAKAPTAARACCVPARTEEAPARPAETAPAEAFVKMRSRC